jgi:hypothetical protein
MKIADSTLKDKGKRLVNKLSNSAELKSGGIGLGTGAFLDDTLYKLTHKFPKLAESTGVYVPGYAEGGIHWDDVIGQSVVGIILLDGIRRRSLKQIIFGIAAAFGEFYVSQTQY